jgi:hypothetical protein
VNAETKVANALACSSRRTGENDKALTLRSRKRREVASASYGKGWQAQDPNR